MRMKKAIRAVLLAAFSCVPGCGQMYQGYMKRGISQTVLCSAVVALAVLLEIGALAVLIAPLWLYSFFDSFDLHRRLCGSGLEDLGRAEPDAYLFGLSELDAQRLTELLDKRHSLIGWALVLIGGYALYHTVVGDLLRLVCEHFPEMGWLYDLLVWDMPRILGTVAIIALGVWFIRGPKKRPMQAPAFEDLGAPPATGGPDRSGACAPEAPAPAAPETREAPAGTEEERHDAQE